MTGCGCWRSSDEINVIALEQAAPYVKYSEKIDVIFWFYYSIFMLYIYAALFWNICSEL